MFTLLHSQAERNIIAFYLSQMLDNGISLFVLRLT
jgi:hypothetical protein